MPMGEAAKNGLNASQTFSNGAYDLIALAASAGGLRALSEVLAGLPREFPAAIVVVVTGTGSDGSMGVKAIKKMDGTVIVQDERSAEFFGMPGAAMQTGSADFVLPLEEISSALVTLVLKGDVA